MQKYKSFASPAARRTGLGGPQKNLIDKFGYGGYYVKIFDKTGKTLIYSRGFNTLFEEWRTTDQAKTETQSWTNNVSVPFPKVEPSLWKLGRERHYRHAVPFHDETFCRSKSIFIDRGNLRHRMSPSSNTMAILRIMPISSSLPKDIPPNRISSSQTPNASWKRFSRFHPIGSSQRLQCLGCRTGFRRIGNRFFRQRHLQEYGT